MNSKVKTILLVAGGTGGHLFPAIALAEGLKNRSVETHLITDKRCEKYLSSENSAIVHVSDFYIESNGIIKKIKAVVDIIKHSFRAIKLLRQIKPDVVVGFGGYPTIPALVAAKLLNIPIALHETNCLIGKTNRIFGRFAKLISLSSQTTYNLESDHKSRIEVVGYLVRSNIRKLASTYDPYKEIFQIFIVGGSQGASFFSEVVPLAIKYALSLDPDIKIEVVQQASNSQQTAIKELYDSLGVKSQLSEFFFDIHDIYTKTQLMICRAGASTVSEIISGAIPSIFVPYPFAAEDHQYYNAKALAAQNASWVYRQEIATPQTLGQKIYELIKDRNLLKATSDELKKMDHDDAASKLVEALLQIND